MVAPSERVKATVNTASREFFQVSLVTYLLLTLAETLKDGFVSNFFNMNYLLLVVLGTGVAMVLTEPPESELAQAVGAVRDKVQEATTTATTNVVRAGRAVRRQVARPVVVIGSAKTPGPAVIDLRGQAHRPAVENGPAAKNARRHRQLG